MTMDQFFKRLSLVDRRDWEITHGCIRKPLPGGNDDMCPLSSVLDESVEEFDLVGVRIGLSLVDITRIARAADNEMDHDPVIRQRLLDALGLQEVEP